MQQSRQQQSVVIRRLTWQISSCLFVFTVLFLTVILRAAAPTFVSYNDAATGWLIGGTPKVSALVSWNASDWLVVVCWQENNNTTPCVPTGTGLTFTARVTSTGTIGQTCYGKTSTANPGSSGSSVISVTGNATSHWGFGVYVIRNSTGLGGTAEQHTATKLVARSVTSANSYMIWGTCDFGATAAPTGSPSPTNTRQSFDDGTSYSASVFDLDDQSTNTSYGQSNGTGTGPFSIMVLELLNDGGGSSSTCKGGNLTLLGVTCGN